MTAVYFRDADGGRLDWCFADCWKRRQEFLTDTNILKTELRHRRIDVLLSLTDLVPPGETALVRRVTLTRGTAAPPATFFAYFDLIPGDSPERNAVQYEPQPRQVVQHFRDVSLCAGANRNFLLQCGIVPKRGKPATKAAVESGRLNGSDQCIGDVDFAMGFDVGSDRNWELILVLACGPNRAESMACADRMLHAPFADLENACRERSQKNLSMAAPCSRPELVPPYHRALLSLADLYDQNEGILIAAPEFDPAYQWSGGYGYVWGRDAAVCVLTLARVGFLDWARRTFDWTSRAQLPDGHWYHRYWTDGSLAPSWCVRQPELQLDQTCALLHAAGRFASLLELADPRGKNARADFVERYRPTAEKAAAAIERHLDADGLHRQATDLWESSEGCFAYTLAGVIAALRTARQVWGVCGTDPDRVRSALFERFWRPKTRAWARRIDPQGKLDETLDSSALGLIEPWRVLELDDTKMASMARATIETIARKLAVDARKGPAILRFQNEEYMGGGPGIVNTLWLALCRLRLAAATTQPQDRERQITLALASIRVAAANTNPTGQLPELIPRRRFAYWAAPHAWACSLMIECVLALNELDAREPLSS